MGGDCSERICPYGTAWTDMPTATDTAHAEMECSNRGICNRITGRCSCMDGFTGTACERLSCTKNCNGRGTCTTLSKIAEDNRDEMSRSFRYEDVWDADKIMTCSCDPGFSGFDCSTQDCPTGDDPLTTGQVNEVQLLKCIANTGSFVLFFNGKPSRSIDASATAGQVEAALEHIEEITDVKVTFSHGGGVCDVDANIVHIEFLQQFGNLSPLVAQVDETMSSNGGSVSISGDGVTCFNDRDGVRHKSVDGTKEGEYCAGRGVCDTKTGICDCYDTNGDVYLSSDGYGNAGTRGDCGFFKGVEVATCPGFLQCSGHGVCSEDGSFRCKCSEGWAGGDCSERECPKGLSWTAYPSADNKAHDKYTTCSDMGWCDRINGKCTCKEPFYGQACEYMSCGGGTDNPCNGHGRCMSMSEQAIWADKNGDATDYTYGADPNNPYTWDAHRVFGCKCDEGYSGYDCSLRDCPRGNDVGTYEDSVEIQVLQCIADGGEFVLKFRQAETVRLMHNATDLEVEKALEALSTLTDLNVTFYDYFGMINETVVNAETNESYWHMVPHITKPLQNSACNTSGERTIVVTFETTHSDLPAIIPDVSVLSDDVNSNGNLNTGVINVATDGDILNGITSVKGTTENVYCNNRGICDLSTGVCHCFFAWASSDGKGNLGQLGDCGFRNDINSIGGKVEPSHADIYQKKYPEYIT